MTADASRESMSVKEWLTPGRFAALLAFLIFAAFPQVLTGRETFFFRDFGLFGYPLAHYHRESFWRGEIPFWNPLNNCGIPFLAQWNTMVLYPPSLFYLLLPLSWSLGVFNLAHLFLGGLGMYFFVRRWTCHSLAAGVAGVAFAFNGLTQSCLMWPNNIAALGWMPWVIWCAQCAWRSGGRKLPSAALIGALQMLTGAPEIIFFTWGIAGLMWLGDVLDADPARRTLLLRFALLAGLVFGLSAAQLVPFLDLLVHSQRGSDYGGAQWSMPVWGWANFLVPLFRCKPAFHGVYAQIGQFWISSYYAGVIILALAFAAAFRAPRKLTWIFCGAGILSLLLACGDDGVIYGWLRRAIPLLGFMRYPIKFVTVTAFVLPFLAGQGIAWLLRGDPGVWRRQLVWVTWIFLSVIVAIGAVLWWAHAFPLVGAEWPVTWRNGAVRLGFLALALGSLMALRWQGHRTLNRASCFVLLFLVWLDLWTHAPQQNPTVARWVYEPEAVAPFLPANPRPQPGKSRAMISPWAHEELRFSSVQDAATEFPLRRAALANNCNLLDDIPKVDGFFSLYPARSAELIQALYAATNQDFPAVEDFFSVSQKTEDGKLFDWRARRDWLPFLTAGQQPLFADESGTLHGLTSAGFDPRKVTYLPLEARTVVMAHADESAQILESNFASQRVDAEVVAKHRALLVVAQTHYHWWKAYVNGEPARLWRANHAAQAVEIPAGRNHVRLVFLDRGFFVGLAVSLAALAICLVLWRRGCTQPISASTSSGPRIAAS